MTHSSKLETCVPRDMNYPRENLKGTTQVELLQHTYCHVWNLEYGIGKLNILLIIFL